LTITGRRIRSASICAQYPIWFRRTNGFPTVSVQERWNPEAASLLSCTRAPRHVAVPGRAKRLRFRANALAAGSSAWPGHQAGSRAVKLFDYDRKVPRNAPGKSTSSVREPFRAMFAGERLDIVQHRRPGLHISGSAGYGGEASAERQALRQLEERAGASR